MIVARRTGGDGADQHRVRDDSGDREHAAPGAGRTSHAKATVAYAETSTTFAPETTTRCDVFVALRSAATSAGSADRSPSSTPCASDACGSGSASASACDSQRRTCRTVARDEAVVLVADHAHCGNAIVLRMPRRAR